jgi:hypothetical protein
VKRIPCILLCIVALFALWQCHKKDPPYVDPHQCDDVPDYVFPDHEWLQANHVGDTLNFNVYRVVINASGERNYILLRKEHFIATDTTTVIGYADNSNSVCRDKRSILHEQVLNFKGSDQMWSKITPQGYFDWIWIYFKRNYFRISNDAYNAHNEWWRDQYFVTGTTFRNVKLIAGGPNSENGSGYIDSTYCFYNNTYGIIRFIINDTTVYNRYLEH